MKKLLGFIIKDDGKKDESNPSQQTTASTGSEISNLIMQDLYQTRTELQEMEQNNKRIKALNGRPTFHEIDL